MRYIFSLFAASILTSSIHAAEPFPYYFGAEVQYFRARGGPGRNVPVREVKKLWNQLIDRVLESRMNSVIFYIPWDFHEPREGTFDFDGTLDQDGDGNPDYPSRDLRGFLDLLVSRGIRAIMVRPGPYINAEWGPEGFGAIPKWFLDRYPQALAGTRTPGKPRTITFSHPVFRDRAAKWLNALHARVLKDYIGPGKPIRFLQIDNETNYFWDSIYERDYNPVFLSRFAVHLRSIYGSSVDVSPPLSTSPAQRHYDWFHFHDLEIRDYYRFVRKNWEDLGVTDRDVLFTSCDSFNAPAQGLLPRLDYRQEEKLTLTTMNIYPKTFGTQAESTLNTPMKAAHDAALILASHRAFYGTTAEWLMSTETVGGWFPPVEVSLATRQHTYASLIGAGVKAMFIYYFHEGWNWNGLEQEDSELRFDAPLDKSMSPRPAFALLKDLGARLEDGLGDLAMKSRALPSPVLIAHDTTTQYPTPDATSALEIASTESAALYGLFREAGVTPDLGYAERMSKEELGRYRLVIWNHPGYLSLALRRNLEAYLAEGGALLWIGKPLGLSGNVLVWNQNFASPWNTDDYTRLKNAKNILAKAREVMTAAGVRPLLSVTAGDSKGFVHASLRADDSGRRLLAVENFLRERRVVTLRWDPKIIPEGEKFRLLPRLGGLGARMKARVISRRELLDGLSLQVSADGADLWEVRPE